MKDVKNEAQKLFIESLTDGGMLDSIFGYAYNRCFSGDEAEDLCQEIIAEILLALQNKNNGDINGKITNLNAYVWQIAHNTYINHVNRQKRAKTNFVPLDPNVNANVNMEDDILERIVDAENLSRIKREIAALPEIYRNAMIMHYLDGLSVAEIAKGLGIPENRVKQRLFVAREKIKKEVLDMSEIKTKQEKQPEKLEQTEQKLFQKAIPKMLDVMVNMIEIRCQQLDEFPERAALFVKILIEAMLKKGVYADELKSWDIDEVVSASRLHDLGKIAIPDSILMKPGKLTQEEFEIMRSHVSKGEEILSKMPYQADETPPILKHAKLFVSSHHERWDGEGFPNRLKGEEIPLEGRIMKVADVYETLVSNRVYKPAFTCKEAEDMIINNGVQFDPKIVEVFVDEEVKQAFAETTRGFQQ